MTSPAPALRPGEQLASTVCTTRLAVIRAPAQGRPLIACGGEPMVPATSARPPASGHGPNANGPNANGPNANGTAAATLIGKRYTDAAETVELLCTSSGAGVLSCDGAPMTVKAAKPLPASD
jgi:hypothetical protein